MLVKLSVNKRFMENPACPDWGEQDKMRRVKGGGYVCQVCRPRKQKRKDKRGKLQYLRPKKRERTGVSDSRPSYLSPLAKRNKNIFKTQGSSSYTQIFCR